MTITPQSYGLRKTQTNNNIDITINNKNNNNNGLEMKNMSNIIAVYIIYIT